jgi:hypothetical protein
MLFMKIEYAIFGILVAMFAAILFVDAILVTYNQSGIPLSSNDVKGITGFVFVIIAAFFFWKALKK